jgi:hypothetical protein
MSRDDRDREAARRRRRELDAEAAEFTRQNQPRDEEERRNAEAEDKQLRQNWDGIVNSVARMSDAEFEKYVKKASTKRKVRRAGKNTRKLIQARKAKRSMCVVTALLILAVSAIELAAIASGLHDVVSALAGR